MGIVTAEVSCPVFNSFRVQQVAGLFDVPLAPQSHERFEVEVPDATEDWQIGLIVGPSGSGKTSIARKVYDTQLKNLAPWPADRAVIDCFGELPIKQITGLLTAVGFSSPPAWIKPYQVLSGGEQFRCDLARALAGSIGTPGAIVAFDEFTSVVDRQVAQLGSAAVSRALRRGDFDCRFVAITCHYDVAEWLEPDWVVDMATQTLTRGRLRRPAIELEIVRCRHAAWKLFTRHHYLSGQLSPTARCFLALWRDVPVAFCATFPMIGCRGRWRFSRIVTLPDFQGLGLGMRFTEAVAELHAADGLEMRLTASHPAVISHCRRSPRWRTARVVTARSRKEQKLIANYRDSSGRAVVTFVFRGGAEDSSPLNSKASQPK